MMRGGKPGRGFGLCMLKEGFDESEALDAVESSAQLPGVLRPCNNGPAI